MSSPGSRPDRRELWLLFGVAVALRAVSAARTVVIFDDGPLFLELAERLLQGRVFEALAHPYHPLYPALIAVGQALGLPPVGAALTVSCVFGGLSVVAFAVFLHDAFGPLAGRLGGWLLAMLPYAVIYASDVQSEGVYLAFFGLAIAALWRALEPGAGLRPAALAGLASGLAYWTRPEGLGVACIGVVLVVGFALARRIPMSQALRGIAALALGAALCVAPYVLALHAVHGEWRLTGKKSVAALTEPVLAPDGLHGGPAEALPRARPAPARPAPLPGASVGGARLARPARAAMPAAQPGHGTGRGLFDALAMLGVAVATIFRSLLGGLLIVGLLRVRGRPGTRGCFIGSFLVAYGAVLVALVLAYGYVDRRHVLPPTLPLLGYAALAVPTLGLLAQPLARRFGREPTLRFRALAGLLLCAAMLLPKALAQHRSNRIAERRAAEWIAERGGSEVAVATPKRRAAFHAGARYVPIWPGERGSTGRQLHRQGADYLLIEREQFDEHPRLEEGRGPGLREVHREVARGHEALVYELGP